jgi:broad specificity phosphatase PhoE
MAAEALTTFLLIRHAVHELGGGTIAGRRPGVGLSPEGRAQAEDLADRLEGVRIDAVYCSPLERTMETALALATARDVAVQTCEDLQEIDYGEWTGRHPISCGVGTSGSGGTRSGVGTERRRANR